MIPVSFVLGSSVISPSLSPEISAFLKMYGVAFDIEIAIAVTKSL